MGGTPSAAVLTALGWGLTQKHGAEQYGKPGEVTSRPLV